ncbi:MAG: Gfo/Idh/MocA family protein [Marinosulfonomonas sp.]
MTGTALIGLGMVSSVYVDALNRLSGKLELHGVLANSAKSQDAFLEKHAAALPKGCRGYSSVKDIAADPDVDFVIVTTPPNARRDIVETLAKAGKHILMEKPVERTVEAATELCEICEAQDVSLGIMLQHRARPSAVELRGLMEKGDLGDLLTVEVNVPWWRDQAYYDAPGRGSYERDGGGVLISQAIHTLDLMLSLTGPVAQVTAMTATSGFHQMESEDFVTAGLKFANGALGALFATTASFPGGAEGITLNCRNATVRLMSNELVVNWHTGQTETHGAMATTGGGADPMAFSSDWHMAVIEDFVDGLAQGRAPMVSGRSALAVHKLIEAIEVSGKTGSRQDVK